MFVPSCRYLTDFLAVCPTASRFALCPAHSHARLANCYIYIKTLTSKTTFTYIYGQHLKICVTLLDQLAVIRLDAIWYQNNLTY